VTKEKIGVGMIGLGSISFSHEAGYADNGEACQIVAMCDVHEEEAVNRAGMYGAKTYMRYQDLLDDPAVGMVDITTPHDSHYEIAMTALKKGKHVFVEKPIAVRSAQGREMVETAKKAGLILGVAENTRFVDAYLAVEKLLKEGILGDILLVRTMIGGSEAYHLKDPDAWHGLAPYGGVILDSTVHNFYLFKWLFGGVKEVQGFAWKLLPEKEMEDNGLILGKLANGAEFQLFTSCTAEIPWMERVEIYGTRAGVIIDQLANPVVKYYLGSQDIDGNVVEGVPFDPLGWKFTSMVAEVKEFVAAVRENRPPAVDPADTVYAVEIVEAVERSIQQKQPVKV